MNISAFDENIKLISFDIFDTLLLRMVHKPIDVFKEVWKEAVKEGITLSDLSGGEFIKLRAEMELRARRKAIDREVTLEEIYAEFPDFIVRDRKKLMDLEVETEARLCYWNDSIYELILKAKEKGIPVVLLSDMYLGKKRITYILEKNGIDVSLFEDIFISCDYRKNKTKGELFDLLVDRFKTISPSMMLHIGDNKSSDHDQALKKDLKHIIMMP